MGLQLGWWLATLFLAGCVRQAYLFQTPYDRALSKALRQSPQGWVAYGTDTAKSVSNYLIPGQFVRVIIEGPLFQEESKSEWSVIRIDTFRIQSDSFAYLPWAGSFRIGGLTVDSAHLVLNDLARRVYKDPKVRLYPMYSIYLLGAVPHPGLLLYDTPHIRLIDLMPHLGTSERKANLREVKILRGNLQSPYVLLVDMHKCSALDDRIYVNPFDIVYVPPRKVLVISENIQVLTITFTLLQALNILFLLRANFL